MNADGRLPSWHANAKEQPWKALAEADQRGWTVVSIKDIVIRLSEAGVRPPVDRDHHR
jgi:hypothetical protein